jgi:aldehyde dehydrogenase (NAD+)
MSTSAVIDPDTRTAIHAAIDAARDGGVTGVVRSVTDRETQLRQMRRMLVEQEAVFSAALAADLGKSSIEAYSTEIGFTLSEVDHTLKHIRAWTQPTRVRLPLHLRPGNARILQEPLGTVLIIAPWNYPLQLLLAPLIPALAAGNTAVLKPSEVAPATAAALAEQLPRYLDERAVQVVTGGVQETTELLAQPFDHIFYTGNGSVGRVVMMAAAQHLTPVTLELGGKSPAIVTNSADIEVSARRIAWGKFVNAGQTCVAPDYVLVQEGIHDRFVDALRSAITGFYGDDPAASPDYGRIVNERHHARLTALLDRGGFESIAIGGGHDAGTRYLAPTVLTGVKPDAAVMDEEIFGPILPVLPFGELDEAIAFVNGRPKPLALYVFANREAAVDRVVSQTSAGGVTVNHTLLHLAVADLPFGGVGPSGMGAYHGEAGFRVFSHAKPVLQRPTKPDPKLAYPPYTALKQRILRRFL